VTVGLGDAAAVDRADDARAEVERNERHKVDNGRNDGGEEREDDDHVEIAHGLERQDLDDKVGDVLGHRLDEPQEDEDRAAQAVAKRAREDLLHLEAGRGCRGARGDTDLRLDLIRRCSDGGNGCAVTKIIDTEQIPQRRFSLVTLKNDGRMAIFPRSHAKNDVASSTRHRTGGLINPEKQEDELKGSSDVASDEGADKETKPKCRGESGVGVDKVDCDDTTYENVDDVGDDGDHDCGCEERIKDGVCIGRLEVVEDERKEDIRGQVKHAKRNRGDAHEDLKVTTTR